MIDVLITFDALIRLYTQNDVLILDARTITLGPGNSIKIEGIFTVTEPGSYVVRWEALTPPPGEALAAGRQVVVVIIEELPEPPRDEPEELPDPGEEGPLPEEPVDLEDPSPDNLREPEPPADPLVEELVDPLVQESPPADPRVEGPDLVVDEPAPDPSPDPEVGVLPANPVLPPAPGAQVEEPARDEVAPVGDSPVIVPAVGE